MEFLKWLITSVIATVGGLFGLEQLALPTLGDPIGKETNTRTIFDVWNRSTLRASLNRAPDEGSSLPTLMRTKGDGVTGVPTKKFVSSELALSFDYPATWRAAMQTRDGLAQIIVASPDFKLGNVLAGEMMTLLYARSWTEGPPSRLTTPQEYVDIKMDYYARNPLGQGIVERVTLKDRPGFLKRTLMKPGIASVWTLYMDKEFTLTYIYEEWTSAQEETLATVLHSLTFGAPEVEDTPLSSNELSDQLLERKRERAEIARAAVETSLFYELLKLTLQIEASELPDIAHLRSFAERWHERIAALYAEVEELESAKLDPQTMSEEELDIFIAQLARLQQEKMGLLSAYNALSISDLQRLAAEDPSVDLEPRTPTYSIPVE